MEKFRQLADLSGESKNQRLWVVKLTPVALVGEGTHLIAKFDEVGHLTSMAFAQDEIPFRFG